jgi:NAD(P)-dependent dehydrogenase (short-subunit alcohol dehydrogenase family)
MTRTYVVTGSASGIGAATVKKLIAAGHTVIGVDIQGADVVADLSSVEGRKSAAAAVIEKSDGTIDAVIACAGLARAITSTVSVNYFGVTEFLTALLPTLSQSKSPRVVVTSSVASLTPNNPALVAAMLADDENKAVEITQGIIDQGGGIERLIYGSTKRAISRWIRRESIKAQWAGAGIALNAVGPAIVKTPMVDDLAKSPEAKETLRQNVPMPLNGFMEPEVVADLLIWLTNAENTHVTGQTIYIDGGYDITLRGENIWDLQA